MHIVRFSCVWILGLASLNNYASAVCVRPISNHWMDDGTQSNISIGLFHIADGPELIQVFLSFAHSGCFAPFAGEHRFVCDGRSIVLYCAKSVDHKSWELGMGQNSVIWSRFSQLDLTQTHVILHTRDSNNLITGYNNAYSRDPPFEFCEHRAHMATSMCSKSTIFTWESAERGEQSQLLTLELFYGVGEILLPPEIYADMQEHISKDDFHLLFIKFEWGSETLICGENCLWTVGYLSPFVFHADIGISPNVVLSERFLQNNVIVYHADTHALYISPVPYTKASPGWKLFSQIFVLFKLVTAVWIGTKANSVANSNNSILNKTDWITAFLTFIICLETAVIQYASLTYWEYILIAFLVGSLLTFSSRSTMFIVLVIQTTLRDMDSYQCVVLLASIQFVILGFLCICEPKQQQQQRSISELVLLFAILSISSILNLQLWILLFIEEIGSLLGSSQILIGVLFLLVLCVGILELFKQAKKKV